ncbi:hypothetical protein [Phenylobacterium sp.]|uniref:hypothetical protein n=1 Tax=Phenylobacterium sp. TaxID=1871053 RepID=UPI00356728AC
MQFPIGRWAARGAAVFCLAFAAFQAALALGAPFGDIAWGGSSPVLPTPLRWASLGAAGYLMLAAALMEVRAGDWGRRLPGWPVFAFNVFLAAELALNTPVNLAAKSGGERYGMGAASALGCLLCLAALIPARKA